MFSGIVEHLGSVASLVSEPPGVRLVLAAGPVADNASLGDSIAVNGCCLTVVEIQGERLSFEAGPETLQRTNLGLLAEGSTVNLERSLKVGDLLGGHYVSGHVDALGKLRERVDEGEWSTFWFDVPAELSRQMASKGSVAVDGVSLTLVEVYDGVFSVQLIPHTLSATTLGSCQPGSRVNVETDILAKYVEQQLKGRLEAEN